MHVHVACPDGEAKFWMEPVVALVQHVGLSQVQLRDIQRVIEGHNREITQAWKKHFGC